MAEERKKAAQAIPPRYDLNAKWDACTDLTVRRLAYSSIAGAFAALLLFTTANFPVVYLDKIPTWGIGGQFFNPSLGNPATRWATVAFGAGVGIGSAYTDCSYIFNGSSPKVPSPEVSEGQN